MSQHETAVFLGYAALALDDLVRDYHLTRRQAGISEDALHSGFGDQADRVEALDTVDALVRELRVSMQRPSRDGWVTAVA